MTKKSITFDYVMAKDLPALAAKTIGAAAPGGFVPITKHRAAAMVKNPFAEPEDVGMVVAYSGDQLAGYFGIMPIMLAHEGRLSKIHWFSTWNVSPAVRGQGIGYRLMSEALKLGYDFVIVGSKPARKVSEKHGFHWMEPLQITILDFSAVWRFNPGTLMMRLFRKLLYVFSRRVLDINPPVDALEAGFHTLIGGLVKRVCYPRLLAAAAHRVPGVTMEPVDQVREDRNHVSSDRVHFYRGHKVVNWMLENPWVVHPGQSDSEHLDFYFSDVRPEFESTAYQVSKDGVYQGYIVFQFSVNAGRRTLKVLDVDLPETSWVLPLALRCGRQKMADQIEFNRQYAGLLEGSLWGKVFFRQRERYYQCFPNSEESPLARHWRDIAVDYPDGDMAFT